MCGVVFRLGGGAGALKPHARRGGSSIPCRHGDEFHQIQRNIFVTARSARACSGSFFHESFSSSSFGKNGYFVVFKILHTADHSASDDNRVSGGACEPRTSSLGMRLGAVVANLSGSSQLRRQHTPSLTENRTVDSEGGTEGEERPSGQPGIHERPSKRNGPDGYQDGIFLNCEARFQGFHRTPAPKHFASGRHGHTSGRKA